MGNSKTVVIFVIKMSKVQVVVVLSLANNPNLPFLDDDVHLLCLKALKMWVFEALLTPNNSFNFRSH